MKNGIILKILTAPLRSNYNNISKCETLNNIKDLEKKSFATFVGKMKNPTGLLVRVTLDCIRIMRPRDVNI